MTTKARIILDDEGETVVARGGVTVKFNAKGGIEVYGSAPVTLHHAANDSGKAAAKGAPEIGDTMPDGTIFAGVSPDTGRNMFVTPRDAPGTLKWKAAMKYAADLDANGHRDWTLPCRAELNVLFENRAKIGGFNTSGSTPARYYWSSSESTSGSAWNQRFSDGLQGYGGKGSGLSVRCVRRSVI